MAKKKPEILLGAHMSIAGGVYNAFDHAEHFGCTAFQIFTKSSNQWKAKPLTEEDIEKWNRRRRETGIDAVVAHDSYLVNLGSPDKELLDKSREAFLIEMQRCELLDIPYLVTHPGSHMGTGEDIGLKTIARSIDWLHRRTPEFDVKICLETTAGQGTNLGYRFEQIIDIIEMTEEPDRLAVCLDTCHIFAAGYDIRTEETYESTMADFDRIIGLDRLVVIHFNDAKRELGSRVDRHEHIGQGQIGEEGFGFFMRDPRFQSVPKILETPKGENGDMDMINLDILRRLARPQKKHGI